MNFECKLTHTNNVILYMYQSQAVSSGDVSLPKIFSEGMSSPKTLKKIFFNHEYFTDHFNY